MATRIVEQSARTNRSMESLVQRAKDAHAHGTTCLKAENRKDLDAIRGISLTAHAKDTHTARTTVAVVTKG